MRRRGDPSTEAPDWEATYSRLRRATETHREDLVLRLGAEAGLQPREMSALTPGHLSNRPRGRADLYPLSVPTDGRTTYLGPTVEHDFRKYLGANDVDEADRVFPVTPRRLQMLVSTVAERAAERTGERDLAEVSSRELRRFFARRLLDDGVPPGVVMKVGGWNSLESLDPFVDEPADAAVVEALSGGRRHLQYPAPGLGAARHDPVGRESSHAHDHAPRSSRRPDAEDSGRVATVLDLVDEVSDALSAATTRDGLERTLCERLGESGVYRFAWVTPGETGARTERTVVGIDEAALGALSESIPPVSGDDAKRRTVRTDRVHPSSTPPVELTSVPLAHGETTFGWLSLGSDPEVVTARERTVLATLGRQVGAALAAAERKRLLVADTVTQLRFACSDERDVFVRLSATLGCTCSVRGVAPIAERSLLCFLAVHDVPTERAFDELDAASEISNVRLIRDRGEESLLEVVLSDESLLTAVTAHDGTVSEFAVTDGTARFAVEFSNETPLRQVVSELTDAYPETELRSKREVERASQDLTDFRDSVETQLTDKQHSALQAAYLAGYFEWPRESTAEDLADSIDVSSPTLHQHLRTAQQKLLTAFFDDDQE